MIELTNLKVEQYIHPDEISAWKAFNEASWLKTLLTWIEENKTTVYYETVALAGAVELNEENCPRVFECLETVCRVLDYRTQPRLFSRRQCANSVSIFYADRPLVVVSDFILNVYDDDMLLFKMGKVISQLKKGNCQMELALDTAADVIGAVPLIGKAALPPVVNWLRKAEYTADRGGLLACQNIDGAAKAIMVEMGLPAEQYNYKETLPRYIKTIGDVSKLANLAQGVSTIYRKKAWLNDRLLELYKWYSSGEYFDLIEDFE